MILFSRFYFLVLLSLFLSSSYAYSKGKVKMVEGPYCCCSDTFPFPCRDGDQQHCCSYKTKGQAFTDPSDGYVCSNNQANMNGNIDTDPNPCGPSK
jgi:hypothetical protein